MADRSVGMSADTWNFLYGTGDFAGGHPDQLSTGGWEFDFGSSSNDQVDYLTRNFSKPLDTNWRIEFRGTVTSTDPVFDWPDNDTPGTAYATMLLRKKGDNALTDGNGRFWCASTRLNLVTTSGAFTLSSRLNPDFWTNVDGQKSAKKFKQLIRENLGSVGLTFAGGNTFGHGAWMDSGTCTLAITRCRFYT
jgi:hypothetical protein